MECPASGRIERPKAERRHLARWLHKWCGRKRNPRRTNGGGTRRDPPGKLRQAATARDWGKRRWDDEKPPAASGEARPRTHRSTRLQPAERRRFRGGDDANAGGSAQREAPRRAEAPRPCGQATKQQAPRGGAEGRPEEIEKRERWSPLE